MLKIKKTAKGCNVVDTETKNLLLAKYYDEISINQDLIVAKSKVSGNNQLFNKFDNCDLYNTKGKFLFSTTLIGKDYIKSGKGFVEKHLLFEDEDGFIHQKIYAFHLDGGLLNITQPVKGSLQSYPVFNINEGNNKVFYDIKNRKPLFYYSDIVNPIRHALKECDLINIKNFNTLLAKDMENTMLELLCKYNLSTKNSFIFKKLVTDNINELSSHNFLTLIELVNTKKDLKDIVNEFNSKYSNFTNKYLIYSSIYHEIKDDKMMFNLALKNPVFSLKREKELYEKHQHMLNEDLYKEFPLLEINLDNNKVKFNKDGLNIFKDYYNKFTHQNLALYFNNSVTKNNTDEAILTI